MAYQQQYQQQQQVPPQQQQPEPEQTDQQQSVLTNGEVVPPPPSPVGYRKPFNPCFMKLKLGAMIVAIIDMVLTLGAIICLGFVIDHISNDWSKAGYIRTPEGIRYDSNANESHKLILGIFISMMFFMSFEVILAIVLLGSIVSRSYANCRCWLFATLIFNFIVFCLAGGGLLNKNRNIVITVLVGVGWLWRIYEFIVIWAFCKELKQNGEAGQSAQFFRGNAVGVTQVQQVDNAANYNSPNPNTAPNAPAQQYQSQ